MTAENEAETEFHRWASEQLEVPSNAPPAEVKRAFLRRLWADRFCPPVSIRQSYDVLRDSHAGSLPPWDEAWLEGMQRVRTEVEVFAAEFFQLPPGVRQSRWKTLKQLAAPFPRLDARLCKLQFGLTVELKQHGVEAPLVDRLARACCALFVLRPTEQPVLRQSLEAEFDDEASKWAVTAKILRAQSPEIATLAPYLIQWLVNYPERSEQTTRAVARAAASQKVNWAPEPERVKRGRKEPVGNAPLRILVSVAILIGLNALRSASEKTSHRSRFNYSSPVEPTSTTPKMPAKPTIEPVDTSLSPPEINTQAVELLDERRDIRRRSFEFIIELLRQEGEKPDQSQEKPNQDPDVRPAGEPDAAKDPP